MVLPLHPAHLSPSEGLTKGTTLRLCRFASLEPGGQETEGTHLLFPAFAAAQNTQQTPNACLLMIARFYMLTTLVRAQAPDSREPRLACPAG